MSAAPQLDLWLALAAGRLLLHRSDDAGLTRLAATRLDTTSPQALSASIASGGTRSRRRVVGQPASVAITAPPPTPIGSNHRFSRIGTSSICTLTTADKPNAPSAAKPPATPPSHTNSAKAMVRSCR